MSSSIRHLIGLSWIVKTSIISANSVDPCDANKPRVTPHWFRCSLRVQQQNKTAEAMAKVLMKHPLIEKVCMQKHEQCPWILLHRLTSVSLPSTHDANFCAPSKNCVHLELCPSRYLDQLLNLSSSWKFARLVEDSECQISSLTSEVDG